MDSDGREHRQRRVDTYGSGASTHGARWKRECTAAPLGPGGCYCCSTRSGPADDGLSPAVARGRRLHLPTGGPAVARGAWPGLQSRRARRGLHRSPLGRAACGVGRPRRPIGGRRGGHRTASLNRRARCGPGWRSTPRAAPRRERPLGPTGPHAAAGRSDLRRPPARLGFRHLRAGDGPRLRLARRLVLVASPSMRDRCAPPVTAAERTLRRTAVLGRCRLRARVGSADQAGSGDL